LSRSIPLASPACGGLTRVLGTEVGSRNLSTVNGIVLLASNH